jgi:hypothetical protein
MDATVLTSVGGGKLARAAGPAVLRVGRFVLREGSASTWLHEMRKVADAHASTTPGLLCLTLAHHSEDGAVVGILMTLWDSAAALEAATGGHWDRPVVPPSAEEHTLSFSLEHFEVTGMWVGQDDASGLSGAAAGNERDSGG